MAKITSLAASITALPYSEALALIMTIRTERSYIRPKKAKTTRAKKDQVNNLLAGMDKTQMEALLKELTNGPD